jgi:HTH-type transcriptional regulator/antitoxin HigA
VTIKPIRNTDDLAKAKARLASLLSRNSSQHDDEIEVLATLVEQFEEKTAHLNAPDPISAIKFRMEEKGMSAKQLEPFIGSRARVSEVLSGKRTLSMDMIRSLHEGLGIPYASLISRAKRSDDLDQISGGAIRRLNTLGFALERNEISSFIPSSLQTGMASALLRKTRTQRAASKTDQGALLLWQSAVLQRAADVKPTKVFQHSHFTKDILRKIARLSSKLDGPKRAFKELLNIGLVPIVMPPLPGTFLDGAAMVSTSGIPIIGLTLRHDRIDNFWFTLLHELSHICLHYELLVGTHVAFIDDMEMRSDDAQEQEADELARDALIPSSILDQVLWSGASSQEDILAVSTRARVPVTVVAGRWQRDHQNYKKFSRLIDRTSVHSLLCDT